MDRHQVTLTALYSTHPTNKTEVIVGPKLWNNRPQIVSSSPIATFKTHLKIHLFSFVCKSALFLNISIVLHSLSA